MPDMPTRSKARPARRSSSLSAGGAQSERQPHANRRLVPEDRFFRHIVSSMRNGVIAFRRDGTLALMNDEAYRIFGLKPAADDVGRPFTDVLSGCPEIIRVLSGAFELSHLPNRAEL